MVMSPLTQWLAPGFSRPADYEEWTGIPFLGAIPRARAPAAWASRLSAAVVERPDSAFASSFRNLRAALAELGPEVRVIALTSALPNDGKTTCSLAIARQSALEGYRTVLVDCDLRRGSSTAELGRPPAFGLLEVLEERCALDDALSPDELTPLTVLPVVRDLSAIGRATVQDVFGTEKMARLVGDLRRRFDYVFIDTAPVLAVVDTRRLAPLVDGYVVLTRWRLTPKRAVKMAVDLLRGADAPLAGAVLTSAPPAMTS